MRVAVTAAAGRLDAEVDPRFGRCPCFAIIETDDLSVEALDNANQALGQGAGIQSARLLAERGVRYVLTGNCGPNAHQTLTAAGIGVITGCAGKVREVVEQFNAGRLTSADAPNVPGHSGMGTTGAPAPVPQPPAAPGPGSGFGPGGGGPGGGGFGRGAGQGRGRGLGRGRGQGGLGRGRGGGGNR
jgi:predicted Fe-Mo cluster-binding NifX family protein